MRCWMKPCGSVDCAEFGPKTTALCAKRGAGMSELPLDVESALGLPMERGSKMGTMLKYESINEGDRVYRANRESLSVIAKDDALGLVCVADAAGRTGWVQPWQLDAEPTTRPADSEYDRA